MQAYEFHTTAQDGFIKIPDEYIRIIPSNVKVIVLAGEKQKADKRTLFPDFRIDTSSFVFNREQANER